MEGDNAGPGITATVTSSPNGDGVGSGYYFNNTGNNGNAFTVTGGNITFADVAFLNSSTTVFLELGTPGNGGFFNHLYDFPFFNFEYYDGSNNSTTFAPVSAAVPFELNSTAGLATLGICFGAAKLRRNHLAKKLVVS